MINQLKSFARSSVIKKIYLPFVFFAIIFVIFISNAFPALYGDEYTSLLEAKQLISNPQAVGYFAQLNLWMRVLNQDWFLRILSLIWLGLGIYWLNKWLHFEKLPLKIVNLTILLVALNPFLWMYGFQIRFYSFFFAASLFWIWRFRVWQVQPNRRNFLFVLLGFFLIITSHLLSLLVVGTSLLSMLWNKLGKKRWYLFGGLLMVLFLLLLAPVRQLLIEFVFRMTNVKFLVADTASRGISLAMLAKIPITFFFFLMGERVYPLWWWITVPSLLFASVAFIIGLWKMRTSHGLNDLAILMLLNIPVLFLILDPLAPSGLQGAAPHYVIFVIPYLLLVLAIGAQSWKFMPYALVAISLVGLICLIWPSWSYDQFDLMNWPKYLQQAVISPQKTCIVTDGRAEDSVRRYSPNGTKIVVENIENCVGYSRIVVASNDFRLSQVRNLDQTGEELVKDYLLAFNMTLFPAQITVYDKSPSGNLGQIVPSRLDLPEQDLTFPISISKRDWDIKGFMRLDNVRPFIEVSLPNDTDAPFWILTNYRSTELVHPATPVFSLHFQMSGGQQDIVFRDGQETSSWTGVCNGCLGIASWEKLVSLVGSYSYPGAYQEYQAHIWGDYVQLKNLVPDSIVKITYLLQSGTGYFWGMYQDSK